jgi:hypothetical protein
MLLKQRLIASRFLQAISRIEKNIFSVVPMPFGQRSLALESGLAMQANVVATDNNLKLVRESIRMPGEHVHCKSAIPPSCW